MLQTLFDLGRTGDIAASQASALFVKIDLMSTDRTVFWLRNRFFVTTATFGDDADDIRDHFTAPLDHYPIMQTQTASLDEIPIVQCRPLDRHPSDPDRGQMSDRREYTRTSYLKGDIF